MILVVVGNTISREHMFLSKPFSSRPIFAVMQDRNAAA
jgi:hypothetical protein